MHLDKYAVYAPTVLRVALSLVFLWFGTQQLMAPEDWIGFLPQWALGFPFDDAETFVMLNGWMEVVFGAMMLIGFATRFSALVLGGHLLGIAVTAGGAIGVRDFGLAMATLSMVIANPGVHSLDARMKK
ncbi:MAG: DoxX family protein [Candidatus Uhrbacteria bacterium]|nr:DoxX family protein [Candidatus Uhrbacteria bacterium]